MLKRIPFVTTVYGGTKRLVEAFRTDGIEKSRAVYVPTAPNPTSGYLEIVPLDRIIPQDWSVDEAMTFVVSGGTTGSETIRFTRPAASRGGPPGAATSVVFGVEGVVCPPGARAANR